MADYSLGTAHGEIKITADTAGVDQADAALGRMNRSAQTTEQAMGSVARGTGVAGAAIAGGLGLAVKTAMDFDAQLSGIRSVSGATAGEMDKIRDAALRIGTDTKFSATEAASAIEELAKAGVSTDDILGGVADATIALAAATGTDLTNAATIASDTMNMFGLGAKDMDGIVNTLAQTANASSIGIDDLGMAFSQVGAVANLAGLDVADTASAIGQLGDAGIKGSDAGTSLKTMLMNLQPSTKAQTEAMMDLGLITEDGTNQFYNAQGELKSLREIQELLKTSTEGLTDAEKQMALETIFGSDAIRAAATLADGGAASFDAFATKMANTGTAAEQAKIRQDNLKGSVEQLMGSLETMAISIGTALTPMIRGLADGLGALVGWFNSLSTTQQEWVAGIAVSLAAGLLLVAGILKIVMMFRTLHATMVTLGILSSATNVGFIRMAAQWVASTALMVARGIWWVGQMAIHAALVVAKWAWMGLQAIAHAAVVAAQWAIAAARTVASWALMGAQAVVHAARVAGAWLLTAGASAATAIAQTALAVGKIVAGWALMGVQALIHAAKVALAWFIALGPIGWAIAALIAVVAFIVYFWDDIVRLFKMGAEKVKQWMTTAWNWIVEQWNKIVDAFKQAGAKVMAALGQVGTWIQGIWQKIVGFFVSAAQGIWNAMQQAWNWITNVWNQIMGFLGSIPGRVMGVFAAAGSWLLNAGRSVLQGLWNGAQAIWGAVWGWIAGLPGRIMSMFAGAGSWLWSAGSNLVTGLWNGLISAGSWLLGRARAWASNIVSSIKGFFGISSPSKVMADEVGKHLPSGLAVGIEANASEALKAAEALAQGVTSSVGMSVGGPDAFWDGTALGSGGVPASSEVASYGAAQGVADNSQKVINFNTYNPVAERASDSEARRLRALSALGAF